MPAPEYRFLDRWLVPHPIEAVYDLMADVYGYPTWWGDVWAATSGHSGPPAPGTRTQVNSILHGDFEGTASLAFDVADGGTNVTLDFRPRVNKRVVRQLTPLFRPIFRSNHAWAIRRGQKRISEHLQT